MTEPADRRPRWTATCAITVMAIFLVGAGQSTSPGDVITLERITSFEGRGDVMSLQWSPEGTLLAIASSEPAVRVRTTPGGKLAATLRGHGSHVYDVDWNEDGSLLASAACNGRDTTGMHCVSGGIIVWDVKSGTPVQQLSFPDHSHAVATRMEQKEGKASAVDPHSQPGAEVRAVAWSNDGGSLAVGNAAGMVRIWDTATWQVIHESTPHWQITDMAWSRDGRLAVAARDNTVSIWDVSDSRIANVINHHTLDIYAIAWHPVLPLLASSSGDRTVMIWDAASEQIVRTLEGFDGSVRSVAWHPNGRYLAVTAHSVASGAGEIWVYDTARWERIARGIGEPERAFRSVTWSPDGSVLASGGNDYLITLWRFTVYPSDVPNTHGLDD